MTGPLTKELERVLEEAGGVYELVQSPDGVQVRRAQEDLLREEILEPALRILGDKRLAAVRRDLEAALRSLSGGGRDGHERAIQEAAAAVEGALAVLMEQHGLVSKATSVNARWVKLCDAGVLASHFEALVTAAAVIRNKEAGHSRQTTPRSADVDSARAAVYSACVAIGYLGSRLSGP